MSTITREFAKEQLIEKLQHRIAVAAKYPDLEEAQIDAAIFKIALASLEAEAVAWCCDSGSIANRRVVTVSEVVAESWSEKGMDVSPLYPAPPAPANPEPVAWLWSHRKHQSEVTLVRPEDDEKAEPGLWSGWSCQALYLVPPEPVSQETADREMLKRLSVILSGCDAPGEIRSLTVTARSFVERCKTLAKERDECRISMRQGFDGNSPTVPEWHAEAEKMAELHGISFVVFRNGESPKYADPSKVIISFTDEGLGHGSAAPQQQETAKPKK